MFQHLIEGLDHSINRSHDEMVSKMTDGLQYNIIRYYISSREIYTGSNNATTSLRVYEYLGLMASRHRSAR